MSKEIELEQETEFDADVVYARLQKQIKAAKKRGWGDIVIIFMLIGLDWNLFPRFRS